MSNNARTVLILFAVLVVAVAFRLPRLTERPMHGDEANQAYRAGILYETGVYEYDPHEHHGPTLYYFSLPFLWLSGADDFQDSTEYPYRLEIVCFGLGLIFLLWLLRDAMGNGAVFWAGLLMAVSPIMVYYNRYFIQETLLLFFAFAAIACGWRYCQKPNWGWSLGVGISLGLVHATKETSVLIFAAMGLALGICLILAYKRKELNLNSGWAKHLALVIISALMTSFVLYTSFFTHWRGPLDAILTYATYLNRTDGTGSVGLHDKPWHYYLGMLLYSHREAGPVWSEAFVVVCGVAGLVAGICGALSKTATNRPYCYLFLSVYTFLLIVAYSLIPYKTPWNALVFYHPLILLAGIFVSSFYNSIRNNRLRYVFLCLLIVPFLHLARLSVYANFTYAADTRNPYVYAHTSTALYRFTERVEQLAAISNEGYEMPIHIIKPDGDYWPLPWYLRKYSQVGYWQALPESLPEGKVYVTDARNAPAVFARLGDGYISENHGLRPNARLVVFIDKGLWAQFMKDRQ